MNMLFFVGLIGLLIGGFKGLIIALMLGLMARFLLGSAVRTGLGQVQERFLDTTFAVMGALTKADGVVTRDEIDAVQRVFGMLRMSESQRELAKAAFNRGKEPDFDLDAQVDQLRAVLGAGGGPMLRLFLQLQCMAVTADGTIHPAEHAMLVRVARRLGLTERDVAQLEALLRASRAGPSAGGGRPGMPPTQSRLDDAYTALGISATAGDADIKRAYRRLVAENHPDKLATRGLPDSVRQVAEERIREINVAYDLIKEARGFK